MKPDWFPECPYPESVFPMDVSEYEKIVPDPRTRTALSGCLGRQFWELASSAIWEAMGNPINYQPLKDVYMQYKHLDTLLSDEAWMLEEGHPMLPQRKCLLECWRAIKMSIKETDE